MFGKEPVTKYKSQIVNLSIILVFVVVAINVHKVQNKKILSASEKRDTELKKNKILEEISQLEGKIEGLKSVVNNKDVYSVINTLGNMAKEAGVKILSVKPASEQDFPFYVRYPFELVIETNSYHTIGKFISKIESHSDIYTVETLAMEPLLNLEQGRLDKVKASLKIGTVLFKIK